jgi:hypothetical protein
MCDTSSSKRKIVGTHFVVTSMLDRALAFLLAQLKGYLLARPDLSVQDPIELAHASRSQQSQDNDALKLTLSLINIEEERHGKVQTHARVLDGRVVSQSPPQHFNAYVMIASRFSDYETSLKYLSAALACFQARRSFLREDFPALDPRIDQLVLELHNLSLEQLNHLWGFLGGKYVPSVVYKLRLVEIQDADAADAGLPIERIGLQLRERTS